MNYSTRQSLFDAIKAADGSTLWAMCGELFEATQLAGASNQEGIVSESEASALFDDPARARAWWLDKMYKMVNAGNQQAAKNLQDALGIISASSDLSIEVVDYANALIDCPACGINLLAPTDCAD